MSVDDSDDYEISHHIYQPGELIIEAGQAGRYIYLVTDGEVDAVSPDGAVHTLGPGSYFGHTQRNRRVHQTFRSKTEVRAVTVRSDQAHRLNQVLKTLGKAVATAQGDPADDPRLLCPTPVTQGEFLPLYSQGPYVSNRRQ